eukprot:TRINITY_DN5841_c0_g1_i1.p1 TRINITY_DN5841_c0_g1~~TRINITY_DN5841_c0_g1_i1.p1  ORF type:complete len:753 (-),score=150.30 TRINITY_DN5841_c0_g1_i1:182-2440(-)
MFTYTNRGGSLIKLLSRSLPHPTKPFYCTTFVPAPINPIQLKACLFHSSSIPPSTKMEGDSFKFVYPVAKKVDHVDEYHGVKVEDPYRWLEEDIRTSSEVSDWAQKQSELTNSFLDTLPYRKAIETRLTEIWNYEKYSVPWKGGKYYFFSKNNGLQNQSVFYVTESSDPNGPCRVLIDPNTLSEDGTVSLQFTSPSDDGKYMAYGLSSSGSDWVEIRLKNVETGEDLPDLIKWVKFSSATWTVDGKGFFYGRFEPPKDQTQKFLAQNKFQKLYYHRIGTLQSEDVLVYHRPDEKDWGFSPTVTEDGRYLVISIWKAADSKYRFMVKDLMEPYGCPLDIIDNFDNEYDFVGNDGPIFYFYTDLNAPLKRLISIDITDTSNPKKVTEIIPQLPYTLDSVTIVNNMFIGTYLKDAYSLVKIYGLNGKHIRDLELPGIGTVSGFYGRRNDPETFYSFSSFATPQSIYKLDLVTLHSERFRSSQAKFDSDLYETTQRFYLSKDGTQVPMFIVHKKGIQLDGKNPVLLYGYGGFNISITPSFSVSISLFLEMGGVYAVANIRGGGEYGSEWHDGGKRMSKQNGFDDFISAAEFLIKTGYCTNETIAISGASNGGLLIGAVVNQRPDLFKVGLPSVGVMDMLRYHKFTAGKYWIEEYGSSDNKEDFENIYKYSPYHNLKPINYPNIMVFTADTDDRVVPAHSFKYGAKLQAMNTGKNPVLMRIDLKSGHGGGKPTSKIIQEQVDKWSFIAYSLKMHPKL